MAYLDDYGSRDVRRERLIKRLALLALAVSALSVTAYFLLRDREEKRQITRFFELLAEKNYKAAYALWGCTDEHPCREYSFERFMEDWGPQSENARAGQPKLGKKKSCKSGIIQFVQYPGRPEIALWVERKDKTIGFAPWPVCNPQMKVP